jgi:hypothetical protein
MTTLSQLKAEADKASDVFEAACLRHYSNGKWGYYRAFDDKRAIPAGLDDLRDTAVRTLHAFYSARDGERGFLGSRGA